MNCNCAIENKNVIHFIKGTTVNLTFSFDEDISSYTYANFGIARNYGSTPVIDENIDIEEANTINIELTPTQTGEFNEFLNGKSSEQYLWWLDLIDTENDIRVNVFPQTGEAAPLCIVYKHV